jgi:hypothetical protein
VVGKIKINFNVILACLLMLTLILLSIIFYKQRIAYHDTAGYFISLVYKGEFNISHSRYIGASSQWLPLLLLKAGSSFKALALGYSLANVLFPILLSFVCLFIFKDANRGLAILIYWILLDSYLFYYTCSEVPMGLALLMFYDGFLNYMERQPKRQLLFWIISIIVLPTVLFSHPMNLLVIFAWLGYRYMRQSFQFDRRYIFISAITIAAYILKKVFFVSTYEMEKTPGVERLSKLSFDMYHGTLATSFYNTLLSDSFLVPLLLLVTLIVLIRSRRKALGGYLFLTVSFFFTLILLVFQTSNEILYDQYYEHLMQPLSFFIVLAFMDVLRANRRYILLERVSLLLIGIISVSKIVNGSQVITDRHEWYGRKFKIMDACAIRKAIILRDEVPDGNNKSSYWNAGAETLFLSSLAGNEHNKTIFMVWPWIRQQSLDEGNEQTILYDGFRHQLGDYPAKYFNLGNERYTWIRKDTCIKN